MERFRACFEDLVDPRTGNAQRHDLLEMLLIGLAATLCGAETCVDMAVFGRAKEPFLRRFLRLEGGIPSHDTFSRLFRMLDPDGFEASFGRFVAAFAQQVGALQVGGSEVVAVDGKTARRSFDHQDGRRPLHMVSAWGVGQQLVLGQQKVGDGSNEIEALPELLALLALEGRIVTADAMHCQRATAQTILDRGGDYCLALKGNQPALFEDVRLWLDDPATTVDDVHETVDGDHGRIETRRALVVHDIAWLTEAHAFPGLAAVAKVTATREIKGKSSTASRYYVLSKPLTAARLAEVVRTHWQIENCLHWVLDVVMDEDQSRSRKDHAPENLARLRRFALNLIRANKDKGSTRGKIKRAAWDLLGREEVSVLLASRQPYDTFLLKILADA
jgi:predicted transposase YbfD/YdcC